MTGIGGGDIACRIARGHGGAHIAVRSQHRTGNIHAPGFTVGIDCCLVRLGTDFYGNRVACLDLIADFTRHRDGLTRFAGIDDVV